MRKSKTKIKKIGKASIFCTMWLQKLSQRRWHLIIDIKVQKKCRTAINDKSVIDQQGQRM